jgi:hypothetical protein
VDRDDPLAFALKEVATAHVVPTSSPVRRSLPCSDGWRDVDRDDGLPGCRLRLPRAPYRDSSVAFPGSPDTFPSNPKNKGDFGSNASLDDRRGSIDPEGTATPIPAPRSAFDGAWGFNDHGQVTGIAYDADFNSTWFVAAPGK